MLEMLECKLPYEQLLDSFDGASIELDEVAQRQLTVGKLIKSHAFLILHIGQTDTYAIGVRLKYFDGQTPCSADCRQNNVLGVLFWRHRRSNPNIINAIVPPRSISLFRGS
jgi:hypothetical protein